MIEILLFGVVFGVGAGSASGFFMGRKTAPDTKTVTVEADPNKFKCPYCQVDVTGYAELDRINHTSCIGKSEADLAAEAKKREAAAKKGGGKYKVTIKQITQKTSPTSGVGQWDWDADTKTWHRYKWTVTKGTQEIDSGYERYKDYAEDTAEAAIELHKDNFHEYEVA